MNTISKLMLLLMLIALSSCVSKKKYSALEDQLALANSDLSKCGESLSQYMRDFEACDKELTTLKNTLRTRQEQVDDLKEQVADLRSQRDKQLEAVGDLTVLSKTANESIRETLSQLEGKDRYIRL